MPVIIVYGMPRVGEGLPELIQELQDATAAIQELELEPKHVSVFFPADQCDHGLGEEIIAIVEGLFNKPRRTPEVRKRLADALLARLVHFSKGRLREYQEACRHIRPQETGPCKLVEVLVKTFDSNDQGFAHTAL